MLSDLEIERFLNAEPVGDLQPWSGGDGQQVEAFYREVADAVMRQGQCLSIVEWDHYGSGYASYVDAFFYRAIPDFKVDQPLGHGSETKGLVVLLSRLAPYYVFMENEKRWHSQGGSYGLPGLEGVDVFKSPAVSQLALQVQPLLDAFGLIRLSAKELAVPLQPGIKVPTILTDPPYTRFDAVFYWED